jgi:hypothetical protein
VFLKGKQGPVKLWSLRTISPSGQLTWISCCEAAVRLRLQDHPGRAGVSTPPSALLPRFTHSGRRATEPGGRGRGEQEGEDGTEEEDRTPRSMKALHSGGSRGMGVIFLLQRVEAHKL